MYVLCICVRKRILPRKGTSSLHAVPRVVIVIVAIIASTGSTCVPTCFVSACKRNHPTAQKYIVFFGYIGFLLGTG